MNGRTFPRLLAALALGLALGLAAPAANAQQLILKGEFGMMAGTMAPPDLYAGAIGAINSSDTLKGTTQSLHVHVGPWTKLRRGQ